MKFPNNIYNVLCGIHNEVESGKRENRKNKRKKREMKGNDNCNSESERKTPRIKECARRKDYNKRISRSGMKSRNNKNIMVCIMNSE